jgi:hypothetical protein
MRRASVWLRRLASVVARRMSAWLGRLRVLARRRLRSHPAPTFCIASASHRRLLQPFLESAGWVAGASTGASLYWQLSKKLLPATDAALLFNGLPNLLLLDDKAVLALLSRRFTRTTPLTTHVLYGEWDGEGEDCPGVDRSPPSSHVPRAPSHSIPPLRSLPPTLRRPPPPHRSQTRASRRCGRGGRNRSARSRGGG